MVAKHLPQWEVIDYASKKKPDVPSGTARELAEKLSAVHKPEIGVPVKILLARKKPGELILAELRCIRFGYQVL